MSTAEDLHRWYRTLFGSPESVGLTRQQLGTLLAPATLMSAPDFYYGHGIMMHTANSSYYHPGSAVNFQSLAAIRLVDGDAAQSPGALLAVMPAPSWVLCAARCVPNVHASVHVICECRTSA